MKTQVSQTDDEEIEFGSCYGYPPEYKIKKIEEQLETIKNCFNLGSPKERLSVPKCLLPLGADGWFVVPKVEEIASSYEEAVNRLLILISEKRQIKIKKPSYLHRYPDTSKKIENLYAREKNCFIIIPAQMGKLYAGKSVRRARKLFAHEFGLGSFEILSILITHPDRLVNDFNLYIDAAGDECELSNVCFNGDNSGVPCIGINGFSGSTLFFTSRTPSFPHPQYGSATGFII